MEASDVIFAVESVWKNTVPQRRLATIAAVRRAIPDEHKGLFDALIDAKVGHIEDDPNAILLFLVHGIQTDGAWQRLVQHELRDIRSLNTIDLGYECVTPIQLAGPFRAGPCGRIIREIRDARRREPQARMMIIAHSFGSYILSRILVDHPDIIFERILLCGSIVPRNFAWDSHARQMPRGSVINDVGAFDFYPVLATFSTFGYGSSGRRGFQNSAVVDRYFPYGHSTFFERKGKHIRNFWRPFIEFGVVKKSVWERKKPKTSIPILMLSHPWIGRSIFYFCVLAVAVGIAFLAN